MPSRQAVGFGDGDWLGVVLDSPLGVVDGDPVGAPSLGVLEVLPPVAGLAGEPVLG
jgi:hypothetical protein